MLLDTDPIPLDTRFLSYDEVLGIASGDALLKNDQVTFTKQLMEDAICIGLFPISKSDTDNAGFFGLEPLVRFNLNVIEVKVPIWKEFGGYRRWIPVEREVKRKC